MWLAGTNPQNIRLSLPSAAPTERVYIAIWYAAPNKLEIYRGRTKVPSLNPSPYGPPSCQDSSCIRDGLVWPSLASDPCGANAFIAADNKLHVIVCGGVDNAIEIRTVPIIVLSIGVEVPGIQATLRNMRSHVEPCGAMRSHVEP